MMRKRRDSTIIETAFERTGSWILGVAVAVTPLVYWPVARDPNLAKPILLTVATGSVLVLLGVSRLREEPVRVRWTSIDPLVVFYLVITSASWTYSAYRHATVAAIRPILIYTVFYLVARVVMRTEAARRRLLLGLLAGCAVTSAIAVGQQFDQISWGTPWGVPGTWFNRTFLAAYLLLILPVAAWSAFTMMSRTRAAGVLALTAGVPALAFTGARIAWVSLVPVAFVAAILAWPALTNGHRRRTALVTAAMAGLVAVWHIGAWKVSPGRSPVNMVKGVFVRRAAGDQDRMALMEAAWRVGLDSPVFGCGAGAYGIHAPEKISHSFYEGALEVSSVYAQVVITNAHNEFVEVFAELGTVGLIVFLGISGSAFWMARRALRRKEIAARDKGLLVALSAGVVGFMLANAVGISARVPGEGAFYYLLLALIAAIAAPAADPAPDRDSPRRPVIAVLAVALIVLAAAGWGYVTDLRSSIYVVRGESLLTSASDITGARAALCEFRRACAVTPESPVAQYDLANALAVLGRHEEALRVYMIVEELSPNHGRLHFNQGTSLFNLRRYYEAEREMALAYRLDGLPDSKVRLDYLRDMLRTNH